MHLTGDQGCCDVTKACQGLPGRVHSPVHRTLWGGSSWPGCSTGTWPRLCCAPPGLWFGDSLEVCVIHGSWVAFLMPCEFLSSLPWTTCNWVPPARQVPQPLRLAKMLQKSRVSGACPTCVPGVLASMTAHLPVTGQISLSGALPRSKLSLSPVATGHVALWTGASLSPWLCQPHRDTASAWCQSSLLCPSKCPGAPVQLQVCWSGAAQGVPGRSWVSETGAPVPTIHPITRQGSCASGPPSV